MASIRNDFVGYVNTASGASDYDATVIVGEKCDETFYPDFILPCLKAVKEFQECDSSDGVLGLVQNVHQDLPRLVVWSPTGPLNRDYDDVRRYRDAAVTGIKRATKAGKTKPLLVVSNSHHAFADYKDALLVSLLGALEAVYVPLEVREALPDKSDKVSMIGLSSCEINNSEGAEKLIEDALGLEYGRIIARDIGGSDPERMAPPKVEEYLRSIFNETCIRMSVVAGHQAFAKDYPLFAAVDRCSDAVSRHQGRIILLEYSGEDVRDTFLFVGKGVTYDTGGADVKAGGRMAGMHRDKCGAATVAGLFGMLERLKPKGVKVVGRLAMVRNSIGADSYVADEIITSAAGVRVRVRNTDAEGRMAMADPLYYTKEQALHEKNPHIYTIATLTGHAGLSWGKAYSVVMDNGPARREGFAQRIQDIGHQLSDPFEVSTIRREDYDAMAGRNEYEDVIQSTRSPTAPNTRGHQNPAAFMIRASGLDKHGVDGVNPLKYTHVDIAASCGHTWTYILAGMPTAAPLLAFAKIMKAI